MLLPSRAIRFLANKVLPKHIQTAIDEATPKLNSLGYDRWGLSPEFLKASMAVIWPIYHKYFRVRVFGKENIPKDRVMLIANHSGQLPFDAMIIMMALLDQAENKRICRSMVEYWVPTLPFISDIFTRCGQIVGEPSNCLDLLNNEQCLLVFPEGVGGLGKPYSKSYQLQKFGTGFCHLSIAANAPMVPVAVIGAEEIYPSIGNMSFLAKLMKAPYLPITPTFPLLGLAGALPLPSPIDICFGKPVRFESTDKPKDQEVKQYVQQFRSRLQREINQGLERRGGLFHQRRLA